MEITAASISLMDRQLSDAPASDVILELRKTINEAGSRLDRLTVSLRGASAHSLMGYLALLRDALAVQGLAEGIPASFLTLCCATLRYLVDGIDVRKIKSRYASSYEAERTAQTAIDRAIEGLDEWVKSVSIYLGESNYRQGNIEGQSALLSDWRRISEAFAVQQELRERLLQRIKESEGTPASRLRASREGALRLGREFQSHAKLETMESYSWAAVAIAGLVAASTIAAFWLLKNTNLGLTQELARLAATLPLIGLSGYASRIANQHRENARWSRRSAVRLETITDYSRGLSDEDARDLRKSLGVQVFTAEGPLTAARERVSPNDDIAKLVQQISGVLQPYQVPGISTARRASKRTRGATGATAAKDIPPVER